MRKRFWMIPLLALVLLLPVRGAKALTVTSVPGAGSSRVIDEADIFTDEEELRIAQAADEQAERGKADIVVVTNLSSEGKTHMEFADDYYDNNGYGYGENHDGILLYICMEPGNRGWWTAVTGRMDPAVSTGPVLYTEAVANQLDDKLYDYMVAGRYGDGVLDWIGNVGTWLAYGTPFAPIWYPTVEEQASWTREKNASAPRISDSAGWLSKSEIADLEKKAADLSERYGTDVVIHTARSDCGMGAETYAKAFYQYGGYGLYSDYSGVLLVMFGEGSSYALYTEGDVPSVFEDEDAVARLLEMSESGAQKAGKAAGGAEEYLKLLDKALGKNKVPHGTGTWLMSGVFAALAGLLTGGISRGSASASMKTVRTAFDSNDYLVDGSFQILGGEDRFIDVTTTRVYSPPQQKSNSGGGGGSTYSGGHTSSSGTSHAGSGRKF